MSTNSRIGKLLPDGRVRSITCHWDGYIQGGVGEDLFHNWTEETKVDALLDLGNLSAIGKEIGEKQNFNDPSQINRDWCLAYERDRNKTGMEAKIIPLGEFETDFNWPFLYLYKEGEWFFCDVNVDRYCVWKRISSVFNIKP